MTAAATTERIDAVLLEREVRGLRVPVIARLALSLMALPALSSERLSAIDATFRSAFLLAAQSIAHRHGGHISVESDVGHGATFTIRLPLPT